MNIRNEIENLALWYMPVFIVVAMLSTIMSGYAVNMLESDQRTLGVELTLFTTFAALVKLADNLVIAIWLFIQSEKQGRKKLLWFFFGIVAHFFAVILYLGLYIYESKNLRIKDES